MASQKGHEGILRILLNQKNINLRVGDERREMVFHMAVRYGRESLVRLFLEMNPANLDVNSKNFADCMPLIEAISSGHEEIACMLIQREDVDVNLHEYGYTALMSAAEDGHEAIVRLLLEREDIDVNLGEKAGVTALICAAWDGHEAIVRLLLEREDIDVNLRSEVDGTALVCAAQKGHKAIVSMLLERKDYDINEDGPNVLRSALQREGEDTEAIVKLLRTKLEAEGVLTPTECENLILLSEFILESDMSE
jgi:ankyrin repeat protein